MRYLIQLFAILICICAFSCHANATKEVVHYKLYKPNIHVLTVDPQQVKIIVVRSRDIGQGLDSVANMARHFNALAAVNGGYFRLNDQMSENGVPAGVLKINNIWHGIAYKPRGAIGWNPETRIALIDIINTDSKVLLEGHAFPINAMNKLVSGNRAALLSDSYIAPIEISNTTGIMMLDQHVQGIYNSGSIVIPNKAYFYNINSALPDQIKNLKIGDAGIVKIQVQPHLEPKNAKNWDKMSYILGGGPVLINKNQKNTDFIKERMSEEFINGHYARTAIGILPDKRWVFVVAERSPLEDIVGLSIPELCDFMYSLGCEFALNLDGGGSSAMYIDNVTHVSLTTQPVADALLILAKN